MHASSGFPHSSQLSVSSFPPTEPVEPVEPVVLPNSFQTHLTYFDILCFLCFIQGYCKKEGKKENNGICITNVYISVFGKLN